MFHPSAGDLGALAIVVGERCLLMLAFDLRIIHAMTRLVFHRMVDTTMQLAVRSKTSDEFAMAGFFQQAYEDGKLREPGKVAKKIYTILGNKYEQGKYISVSEV